MIATDKNTAVKETPAQVLLRGNRFWSLYRLVSRRLMPWFRLVWSAGVIIGDRQTGKTTIAIDAILNQKGKIWYSIYVAVVRKNQLWSYTGKNSSSVWCT